jgi:hypothetical protein
MMNVNEAMTLCKTFNRKVGGWTYYAYVSEVATPGVCFDFEGNPFWGTTKRVEVVYCRSSGGSFVPARSGEAVFTIGADSAERVKAHWDSFLANHSAVAPLTMGSVTINNGPGRVYRGRCVRTTKTRVQVRYKFDNGRYAAPKWFKLSEVSW